MVRSKKSAVMRLLVPHRFFCAFSLHFTTHIIKQKDGVCQEKMHPKPGLWVRVLVSPIKKVENIPRIKRVFVEHKIKCLR